MDLKRLREETRVEHEATETLMPLTREGLTRELYGEVLLALEPLVVGWESWAAVWVPRGLEGLVAARRRGDLLRADLQALGAGVGRQKRFAADWRQVVLGEADGDGTPRGDEFTAAFLGAFYVMEGSRLGGRYLAQHVEKVLGLPAGEGDAFFRGAGEATGVTWRELTARIAEVPEGLTPWVVGAARRTFEVFGEGLRAGLELS